MADFKLINESNTEVVYAHKNDYDNLSVCFNKELKSVDIHYEHFILNDTTLEPQWETETDKWLKHSCKYGYWQSETVISLSADDIVFIDKKCKELFQ